MIQQSYVEDSVFNELVGGAKHQIRIELTIPAERCNRVTNVLEEVGVESRIFEVKSCGCQLPLAKISVQKGTRTDELKQPERRTIVTVIEPNKLKEVVRLLKENVGREATGLLVSPVNQLESL